MNKRLVKIVYGYDIERDQIAARHYYETDEGDDCELIYHSRQDWEDLLYGIRTSKQPVEIKTVAQEHLE